MLCTTWSLKFVCFFRVDLLHSLIQVRYKMNTNGNNTQANKLIYSILYGRVYRGRRERDRGKERERNRHSIFSQCTIAHAINPRRNFLCMAYGWRKKPTRHSHQCISLWPCQPSALHCLSNADCRPGFLFYFSFVLFYYDIN